MKIFLYFIFFYNENYNDIYQENNDLLIETEISSKNSLIDKKNIQLSCDIYIQNYENIISKDKNTNINIIRNISFFKKNIKIIIIFFLFIISLFIWKMKEFFKKKQILKKLREIKEEKNKKLINDLINILCISNDFSYNQKEFIIKNESNNTIYEKDNIINILKNLNIFFIENKLYDNKQNIFKNPQELPIFLDIIDGEKIKNLNITIIKEILIQNSFLILVVC
jgi:hypothetical protein